MVRLGDFARTTGSVSILGTRVNTTSYADASRQILQWAEVGQSRFICAANVHMLMEAYDAAEFSAIVNGADLVAPDGMPLVWMMRFNGKRGQSRVYGPTLMLHVLEHAAREHVTVGFYGSTTQVLESLTKRMQVRYPGLEVPFIFSPPYRDLDAGEETQVLRNIDESHVKILFVGLGCPKQERWMAKHRDRLSCVMVGVGAAFDFHSGSTPQAPAWLQYVGMEWSFRLLSEPKRLWRRYFWHNPRFIFLAVADLFGFFR